MEEAKKLLEVRNLKKYFPVKTGAFRKKQYVKAVEDVSLDIYKGETLGLVGESGCGKTTLGRTIIRLYEPTSGKIVYDGQTIYDSEKHIAVDMLPYRRKEQIIFQDPSASLDPRMTVGEIIGEALDIHKLYPGKAERRERINELLDAVGLNTEHSNRFPHEFSGGQQQRIGIARALAVDPEFIVCDEPISALDGGIDGLDFYRRICGISREIIKPKGFIAFEIGFDQASDVYAIMSENFEDIKVTKDLCGNDRVVTGILK